MRIAMAQINPRVGDLDGNRDTVLRYTNMAAAEGADVVLFPELVLTGYPPEDLLLKPAFLRAGERAMADVVYGTQGIVSIVGFVDTDGGIYNAAAVIENGRVAGVHRKQRLPNYGVFDEARYFQKGGRPGVFSVGDVRFGVNVCEDIWYADGPALAQARDGGARVIFVINASPYHAGKWREREQMLAARAADNGVVVCYLNMTGGQDELVFDGMSVIILPDGTVAARGSAFAEGLIVADVDIPGCDGASSEGGEEIPAVPLASALRGCPGEPRRALAAGPDELEEIYGALVLGTRDYVRKNGFSKAVLGLSGGIDSALAFAIACDALGPQNVLGVTMPSRYSSEDTRSDAELVAANFNTSFLCLPVEDVFHAYAGLLAEPFAGTRPGLAEENLQARIRGTLLMALSNKFGHLVLTTGNKSEMAVGYATLYGDMAGGFAVLKDVPKTLVWRLAEFRNRDGEMIPRSTIERPPSAELRENQFDSDSLPPYDILDPILEMYVEQEKSLDEIVAEAFDEATVRRVINMVRASEYKRRQAPPGVKITPKAFGKDRRLPITNAFREG